MTVGGAVLDEWDFYPCRVDDEEASIFLNMWFERGAPLPSANTLYRVRISIRDLGPHRMGTWAEAETLDPIADQLAERSSRLGFFYVGRLRSNGFWELFLYGPANELEMIRTFATDSGGLDGRSLDVWSKHDPDWDVFRDFLLPSPERRQWMSDQRTLDVLKQQGDPLLDARRIDHWAYFPTAAARETFTTHATHEGFEVEEPFDEEEGAFRYRARVSRTDPIDLDSLHGVVMQLFQLAQESGGRYDGWETVVLKPPPN